MYPGQLTVLKYLVRYNFAFNDPVGLNDPSGAEPPGMNPHYLYDTYVAPMTVL